MGLNLTKEKFDEKVAVVPFSTCHYWMGQANDQGYGLYNRSRAHRISYELHNGPMPESVDGKPVVVRHKCDNRLCVNPDHLILGTQADNMRDAAERGRMPQGEQHARAKLREGEARQIVEAVQSGEPVTAVAARFGVSPGRVSTICRGLTKWLEVESVPTGRSDRRVSDEAAREVYRLAHQGLPQTEIAERFGISKWMVADIKRGATYASVTGHRR